MTDRIELWFPTAIMQSVSVLNDIDYINKLTDKVYKLKDTNKFDKVDGWDSNVLNTINTYNLIYDDDFKILIDAITNKVHTFANEFKCTKKFKCTEAWINIYSKNDYQEVHIHSNNIFSATYLLQAPKGSGSISFKDKVFSSIQTDTSEKNALNSENARYNVVQDSAFIFKSDVPHSVLQGTNESDRISIAFNFKEDNG